MELGEGPGPEAAGGERRFHIRSEETLKPFDYHYGLRGSACGPTRTVRPKVLLDVMLPYPLSLPPIRFAHRCGWPVADM